MALRVIARSAICVIYLEEGWVRIVQRDMLAIIKSFACQPIHSRRLQARSIEPRLR